MHRFICALAASLLACAHGPTPAPDPEPSSTLPASRCQVVPALQPSRLPRPTGADCRSGRASMETGCTAGEPLACHRTGSCLLEAWGLTKPETPGRAEALRTALDVLGRACQAGMAESCVLRAGARTEFLGEAPAATCDDLVRACQLGDEADGCLACMKSGCTGL